RHVHIHQHRVESRTANPQQTERRATILRLVAHPSQILHLLANVVANEARVVHYQSPHRISPSLFNGARCARPNNPVSAMRDGRSRSGSSCTSNPSGVRKAPLNSALLASSSVEGFADIVVRSTITTPPTRSTISPNRSSFSSPSSTSTQLFSS